MSTVDGAQDGQFPEAAKGRQRLLHLGYIVCVCVYIEFGAHGAVSSSFTGPYSD